MYRFVFELGSFARGKDRDRLGPLLAPFVEALANVDLDWLRRNRTPPLYRAGVYYRADHETCPGCEDLWWDIPEVRAHGYGDCEDLVAWRLAELWFIGVGARAHITPFVDSLGQTVYHIRVLLPSGEIEDPSAILGMS